MKVIERHAKRKNRIETVEFTLNEKFGIIAIAAILSLIEMNGSAPGNAGGIAFASYAVLMANFVVVWAIVRLICVLWARRTGNVEKAVS